MRGDDARPRVVVLDRDGTLIDVHRDEETGTVSTAFHPDHIRLLPGVVDGLHTLRDAGFVLAMATNQPGPAKGQCSAAAVRRTNAALVGCLAGLGVGLAAVEVCMHHPDGGPGGDPALARRCRCRKPGPGMIEAIVAGLGASRARSWMVGDSSGDIEAGRAAGVRTGLVLAGQRCELCPLRAAADADTPEVARTRPDVSAGRLDAVARAIVAADRAGGAT